MLALPLDRGGCWAISIAAESVGEPRLCSLLSPAEVEQANRHRIADDRSRYIRRHAALRLVLASYLRASPKALAIIAEPGGKPVLAGSSRPLHFSLSHSSDLALLAV